MIRRSARIEERQREATEAATLLSGSSIARPLANTERRLDNPSQYHLATQPSIKKRRRNELKDDDQQGAMSDQEDGAGSTNNKVYRRTKPSKKVSPSQSPTKRIHLTETTTTTAAAPSSATTALVKTGAMDPCAVLPTEIWQKILSLLPLFSIARVSVVSKAWLDGSRTLPIWKTVCDEAGLGEPDDMYETSMALVCANSYWICERCFAVSYGHPRPSHIPLPSNVVLRNGTKDDGETLKLCYECRFTLHNREWWFSPLPRDQRSMIISAREAARSYFLTMDDLELLEPYGGRRERGAEERFWHSEVRRLALRVHGGLVGIEAMQRGVARKRRELFEERQEQDKAFMLAKLLK
ncbi:hypothetical protein BGX29_006134 [Mortierella sp. GBA35]|nr:hypothetical protein BGX29_006134 [Mortierella sp. GBA35]